MKNVLGCLALATLLGGPAMMAGPAMAADMPLKAPPPVLFTWTGVYAGGFIGGDWSRTFNDFAFGLPATFNQSSDPGIGGGIVGLQYQFGSFVLGVEGNLGTTLTRNLGSAPCSPTASCAAGFNVSESLAGPIWTVGGRGGWAIDHWMPYVSGGFANASFSQAFCVPGACPFDNATASHDGYYIGGGVDWAVFNSWVVGVEYRHYDFGTVRTVPVAVGGFLDVPNTYDSHPRFDTVTFRMTYLFNMMPSGH
jgi:outer membrane immunogenic protein